jgi:hypothetical protein
MIREQLNCAFDPSGLCENAENRGTTPGHGHRFSAKPKKLLFDLSESPMPGEHNFLKVVVVDTYDFARDATYACCASPNFSLETI